MIIYKHNIIKKFILLLFILLLLYFAFNQKLSISQYSITNTLIPSCFNNYKIVHLSDLHYKSFGDNQEKLINEISAQSPDLIVMTGDMIDCRKTDFKNTEALFSGISNIAPIYCVSGNHDERYIFSDKMNALYKKYNITELRDESVNIYSKQTNTMDDYIQLCGIKCTDNNVLDKASLPIANSDHFTILLNHRTDSFDYLTEKNYNLILSGHTHGGIIRLPFVGGLIGNSKTLFPKYDSGMFIHSGTTMISSRGLGTTRNIPRVFNRPDLVVITLHSSK